MSKKIHLTLAVGDYESIRALKEGTVKADGIEGSAGRERHGQRPGSFAIKRRQFRAGLDVPELDLPGRGRAGRAR